MQSFQNIKILQTLYKLQALGFNYIDPIECNQTTQAPIATTLHELSTQITNCHLCSFSKSRHQSLSGYGASNADVMFVDSVVSAIQDETADYYAGRSGEMLAKMVKNVLKLPLHEVFYTHVIKCKPLSFQESYHDEWVSCKSYLFAQIEMIQPKVIVPLGANAYQYITEDTTDFETVRGHIIAFQKSKLIPIYHPSFLLRNPNLKKIVYNDLKTIKSCLQ